MSLRRSGRLVHIFAAVLANVRSPYVQIPVSYWDCLDILGQKSSSFLLDRNTGVDIYLMELHLSVL